MQKHVFDHQHPSGAGDFRKLVVMQRKNSPAPNTLTLQRRAKPLSSARRVEHFVKLARRKY